LILFLFLPTHQKLNQLIDISAQKHSTDYVFNAKSLANSFLKQIREFNAKKSTYKEPNGLMSGSDEREIFVKQLENLCLDIEKIVSQEERCVKLSSPAFAIGDIHANMQ
jgi:hypothetical protein